MQLEKILRKIEKIIPKNVYKMAQPYWHASLSTVGAIKYRFPSKKLHVIAITGTKGKSSTTEFVNAILERAGYRTAILSTIRFKVADDSRPNLFKMTMPGRFFAQKFLRDAVDARCDYAIVEMTSEAAKLYRHLFIDIDTLIFTNLTPEHIESHGGFENYMSCKLRLAKAVRNSGKKVRSIIANISDKRGANFLVYDVERNLGYEESESKNIKLSVDGEFNKMNALAAKTFARSINISDEIIDEALLSVKEIPGRVQHINMGQNFDVIVDYAHTVDSLEKLYKTYENRHIVAVLGACGGGRDKAKQPLLGKVADAYCDDIIVTDEDPYDDDIDEIIDNVASGVKHHSVTKIRDRREAISTALSIAKGNSIVIISGKGTDPYIMRANGTREKWSDAEVAREEISKILIK
jgi:UDP-N-acetylmuramoyl-L-alanyl-D-glutamate--2,6-diaminopimelate ligase